MPQIAAASISPVDMWLRNSHEHIQIKSDQIRSDQIRSDIFDRDRSEPGVLVSMDLMACKSSPCLKACT